MRELLIQLDRELEVRRCPLRPRARNLASGLTVERGVHFDGIEMLGVERELVEAFRPLTHLRIEHAVPRALAGRIVPARRADAKIRHVSNLRDPPDHPSAGANPALAQATAELTLTELFVFVLVEPKRDLRALDQDRSPDQIRVLDHQRNRFLLRPRQRPLLEDRAARADEVEKPLGVDVLLEKLARGRLLVDVDFLNVNAMRIQKTSGVLTCGSGGLRVKGRFRHPGRIVEKGCCQKVEVWKSEVRSQKC
jgi:hypothetical protein